MSLVRSLKNSRISPGTQVHLNGEDGAGGCDDGVGGGAGVRVGVVLGEIRSVILSSFLGMVLGGPMLGASWNRPAVSGFSVTSPGALGFTLAGFESGG